MLDEEAQEDLRANKNLNVYRGALYENIVGEAKREAERDINWKMRLFFESRKAGNKNGG